MQRDAAGLIGGGNSLHIILFPLPSSINSNSFKYNCRQIQTNFMYRKSTSLKLAWAVTGAGHFLPESFNVFIDLKVRYPDLKITTFMSQAAEEVITMYGLGPQLTGISCGGYLEECIHESEQGASFPKTGRFLLQRYDALIISPATSNTVAKLAYGIADTLVTNAAAQAVKGGVPVLIVPVDIEGAIESRMPFFIDREICQKCEFCPPSVECGRSAITDQIDLLKCDGCGNCVKLCSYGAIRKSAAKLKVRDVDARNVKILRELEGFMVFDHPDKIPGAVEKIRMHKLKYQNEITEGQR